MNDPLGIFNSLIILALIKMSIRDHLLALRDIREAEQLSLINTKMRDNKTPKKIILGICVSVFEGSINEK